MSNQSDLAKSAAGFNGDPLSIDTANNRVGIGTTSPSSFFSGASQLVVGSGSGAQGITIYSASDDNAQIFFADGTTGDEAYRGILRYIHNDDAMVFYTGGASERMRIDSNGNITFGSFNASGGSVGVLFDIGGGTSETEIQTSVNGTATRTHYKFINNNGAVGTITTSGTSTAYNTSSDHRLKENVTDVTDGITRVKQLEPKRFNFIADADTTVDGFLAHQAQAVVPEAVTGTQDAMRDEEYEVTPAVLDEDGNEVTPAVMGTRSVPVYQGIDQSKLVPLLTAALKEAITKIETLETEMTSVKARLDALEGN